MSLRDDLRHIDEGFGAELAVILADLDRDDEGRRRRHVGVDMKDQFLLAAFGPVEEQQFLFTHARFP